MEYTRSKYVGDNSYDETFKGDPQEIIELMDGIRRIKKNERALGDNTSSETLQKLGISLMDSKGKLRDMEDIFNDLSEAFSKEEKELVYDQEDAIEFIYNKSGEAMKHYSRGGIKEILEAEEDYMRSIGIIDG